MMMESHQRKEPEDAKKTQGRNERLLCQTVDTLDSSKESRSFVDSMKVWDGGEMQFHFKKSKGQELWTRFIEEFYTSYKKSMTKHASHFSLSRANLTSSLPSIFRIARDHLADTHSNAKLISLKQLKEYLKEHQEYLRQNGYLNSEVARGLEEIYTAVVRLVISEKILGDFYRKTEG
eukprot:TRINITY_DN4049_c0_g2_i4.p1 TRINITY_DN4049_c0_g2~~TRINITY_DN4049_c0_g2_i4.p1  ORF type:complete len:177 (+),score=37.42 TRINITY_DN4049_c0_g2_i4:649-1179(+)